MSTRSKSRELHDSFRETLDEYQQKIYDKRALGIQRISASPGSGKTRLMTRLVASLLENDQINPDEIFVCTFSNRARNHMASGIKSLLQTSRTLSAKKIEEFLKMQVTTIHAQSCRLLNIYQFGDNDDHERNENDQENNTKRFGFMDETELRIFVARWALQHLSTDGISKTFTIMDEKDDLWEHSEQVCRWISRFFALHWNPGNSKRSIANWRVVGKISQFWMDRFRKLFTDLLAYCDSRLCYTFDMMIVKLHYTIVSDRQFADWLARRYRFVFVDEAQDLDFRQAQIIYAMSAHYHNLMMIGDPWQNMYQFRGSHPCWMTNKLDEFWSKQQPPVEVLSFHLTVNYRSHPMIVKAVQSVTPGVKMMSSSCLANDPQNINNNNNNQSSNNDALRISKHEQETRFLDEAIRAIKETVSSGRLHWSDWMILSRYQSSCTLIRDYLQQHQIPTIVDNNNNSDNEHSQQDAVNVCTFHAAKGLENKAVVVNLLSYLEQQKPSPTKIDDSSLSSSVNNNNSSSRDVKLWAIPFLPPLALSSSTKQSIPLETHTIDSSSGRNESSTEKDNQEEHPERANIRVALSRSHHLLMVGLPTNLTKVKNKSVQSVIQDLADIKIDDNF